MELFIGIAMLMALGFGLAFGIKSCHEDRHRDAFIQCLKYSDSTKVTHADCERAYGSKLDEKNP